ncbi:alpha/beta hydrolase [Candidatus Binatia bacterium]|nr:alpha/beta hydrolase [Candidatus Binatia bacterium]
MALLASGCALLATPRLPAPGTASARWLERGHDRIVTTDVELDDLTRGRTLSSRLWWPDGATGPLPLVVQSHGFLSDRGGGASLARALARRGYVVVAATSPGTTLLARGGARVEDVTEQPGDVSFLIDRLLDERSDVPPHPPIDAARIAVMGHSLGGLTATLAAFDPRRRDARIGAAISIAGPLAMFEPRFFASAPVPLLMIAGSGDVIVDYRRNALATFGTVPDETVVLIAGASHTGFDDAASGLARLLDNPDTLACWVLARTVDLDAAQARLDELGREDDGVAPGYRIAPPCRDPPPPVAMDSARQQLLTTLAVTAFLDGRFAIDPRTRAQALDYLTNGLVRENPEVSVLATPRAAASAPLPVAVDDRSAIAQPSPAAVGATTAKGLLR